MSDSDIADIYQNKLRAIDLGQRRTIKQHGSSSSSSSSMRERSDSSSYAGFRSVPEFNTASVHQNQKTTDSANVMKSYELMKRIAGANSQFEQ